MVTVAQHWIAGVTGPLLQIVRRSHAALLVPSTAFALGQRVCLCVVVEIENAVVLDEIGAIKSSVFPRSAVLCTWAAVCQLGLQQYLLAMRFPHIRPASLR